MKNKSKKFKALIQKAWIWQGEVIDHRRHDILLGLTMLKGEETMGRLLLHLGVDSLSKVTNRMFDDAVDFLTK